MTSPFKYRMPDDQQVKDMQWINSYIEDLYQVIKERVPASAERVLAIRKLQECRGWINTAIMGVQLEP